MLSRTEFLGLFPYSRTVRATRWRKLSQGGGTATIFVHRTMEYRRLWQCSSRLSCRTGTGVTAQSRALREKNDWATSSVAERQVSSAVPAIATMRSNCNTGTFSCGCFHRHKAPFSPFTGTSTPVMCTSNKASYRQSWGEIEKRSDPSKQIRWVQQGGKWVGDWPSQRRFASTMPEQHDERKSDSSDSNSRRIVWAGQRVFEEPFQGQLKPSDKEMELFNDRSGSTQSLKDLYDLQEEYRLYQAARKDSKALKETLTATTHRKNVITTLKKIPKTLRDTTKTAASATVRFLWEVTTNPLVLKGHLTEAKHHLIEFVRHHWLGSKLLWNEIKTARTIVLRVLGGHHMTRRERKQLLRTASDILRMVPLAAFLIIPFMDFLLPVAVKLFPDMLPSTFQDSLKEEQNLKRELRLRIAYAGFLQEKIMALAIKKKNRAEDAATSAELTEFIEKAKMGEITNQDIPKFAKMFKDELTLENISRSGLVNMCRYMGISGFGSDNFLRFQLRSKLRSITRDDQRILWEGVSSLSKQEIQEACRERGMRATGLTKQGYARQLSQWLHLSSKNSMPISLLVMSRPFTLEAPDPSRALAQAISAMDKSVVTEVMIEAASSEEQATPEYRARKLESLTRQNKLIEMEKKSLEKEATARIDKKRANEAWKVEETLKAGTGIDEANVQGKTGTAQDDVTMPASEKQFVTASEREEKREDEPFLSEVDIVGDRVVKKNR